MVAVLTASPTRSKVRPHCGTTSSRRYERRRPEKTPLYKIVSECLEGWLADRSAREHPVAGSIEEEFRGTAAHLVDHVIPPVPVRQWVISLPKWLRGVLGDRPKAVAAVTRIFLAEIEKLLCSNHATLPSPRPRVGAGIAITECLRQTTRCGRSSRLWRSGTSGSSAMA